MSVEIQWTDADPLTGEKRFVCVERFAGKWDFLVRFKRRENWAKPSLVTRDMWEVLLDAVERRAPRREGVTDEDVKVLKRILIDYKDPPVADAEESA